MLKYIVASVRKKYDKYWENINNINQFFVLCCCARPSSYIEIYHIFFKQVYENSQLEELTSNNNGESKILFCFVLFFLLFEWFLFLSLFNLDLGCYSCHCVYALKYWVFYHDPYKNDNFNQQPSYSLKEIGHTWLMALVWDIFHAQMGYENYFDVVTTRENGRRLQFALFGSYMLLGAIIVVE